MAKGHLVTDEDVPSSSPKKKSYEWWEYSPVPGAGLATVSVGLVRGLAHEIHKIETDSDYRERLAKTFNLVGNILLELIKSFTGITAIIYGIKAIQDAKKPEEKLLQTVSLFVTVLPGLGAGFKALKTIPQVMGLLKMTNKVLQTGLGAVEGAAKATAAGRRTIAALSKSQGKVTKLISKLAHQVDERTGNLNDIKADIEAGLTGISGLAKAIEESLHDTEQERRRLYNLLATDYFLLAGHPTIFNSLQSSYDKRKKNESALEALIAGAIHVVAYRKVPPGLRPQAIKRIKAEVTARAEEPWNSKIVPYRRDISAAAGDILEQLAQREHEMGSNEYTPNPYHLDALASPYFRSHHWNDEVRGLARRAAEKRRY